MNLKQPQKEIVRFLSSSIGISVCVHSCHVMSCHVIVIDNAICVHSETVLTRTAIGFSCRMWSVYSFICSLVYSLMALFVEYRPTSRLVLPLLLLLPLLSISRRVVAPYFRSERPELTPEQEEQVQQGKRREGEGG